MLTTWGAFAEFQEQKKGKLNIGYNADITILSENIIELDPLKVLNTQVLATIINGKIVFNKL